jgi:hypothetical protein
MATISELKKRLLSLQGKEPEIATDSIAENLNDAVQLNRGQLSLGIKKDGSESNFSYAPFTIAVKKGKPGLSGVTDRLTNYDTGESYKNMYAKVDGEKIEFGTTTDKENSISERMEGMAFGLTKESRVEFIKDSVQADFNKKMKQFLKL